MYILAGKNYLDGFSLKIPIEDEYMIGRINPLSETNCGNTLIKLARYAYVPLRRARSAEEVRDLLLEVGEKAKRGELVSDPDIENFAAERNIKYFNKAIGVAADAARKLDDDFEFTVSPMSFDPFLMYTPAGPRFPFAGEFMCVSGQHAYVRPKSDGVYVEDLKSTNGTAVDREMLDPEAEPHLVLPGQTISLAPRALGMDSLAFSVEK
ncbi:MAG: FHA domain-containing protein [Candidatus Aenigmatarchaeota archaeon]|nr:MAG: FHA domain-containing protein [Candidatus Aenigmarchaeota archaeon]